MLGWAVGYSYVTDTDPGLDRFSLVGESEM